MMRMIQQPASLHIKLVASILESTRISFFDNMGYINAKDFQIQCLFEYEKLKSKGMKKRKQP